MKAKNVSFGRFLCFSAVFCVLVVSCGCAFGKQEMKPLSKNELKSNIMPVSEDGPEINYYLDVTASMRGYAKAGIGSEYAKLIQSLEAVGTSTWPKSTQRFFRFGTKVEPLQDREHLQAVLPKFYDDPKINTETNAILVLNQANLDGLTVIISDLFEKDADIIRLSQTLLSKYIGTGSAVAIVGIRSQFDGIVFDVGVEGKSFLYKSVKGKSDTYRPFYIIMAGRQHQILQYIERLDKDILTEMQDWNAIVFSKYLSDRPISISGKLMNVEKTSEVRSLLSKESTYDNRVRQFLVKEPLAKFAVPLEVGKLPFSASFGRDSVEAIIVHANKTGSKDEDILQLEQVPVRLNLAPIGEKDNQFIMDVQVDSLRLAKNEIYELQIQIQPKRGEIKLPEWIKRWAMDENKIDLWNQNPEKFDGSGTMNFVPFMQSLLKGSLQSAPPSFGLCYFYLKRD